jgi:hypothetical protein
MPQREKKIEEILREAAAAVAAADVPEDLRSVAFGKAVDLIVGIPTASDTGAKVGERPRRQQRQVGSTGNLLELISGKFEAEIEVIDEAFEVEDGVPQLTIPRSKLPNAKKAATKQTALLVAAGRQAAEVEEWTESKVLRETVERYGKYNAPNFAAAVSELEDDFSFSGKGQSRRVKVRRDGFKNAGTLVKQLLGKNGK